MKVTTYANRDDWLAARSLLRGFGASEAANFFGCGFQSAAKTVLVKAGLEPAWQPSAEQQEKFEIATELEQAILERLYRKRTGRVVGLGGLTIFQEDDLFATPDALSEERVVQAKTSAEVPWDEPPLGYVVQVQQEMFCTERKVADIAALFYGGGTLAFRVYEVPYDPEFAMVLAERVMVMTALVDEIKAGARFVLPEPGPQDGAMMARLAKKTAVTTVHQFNADEAAMVERWARVNQERKVYASLASSLEDVEKHERHKIAAVMRGAEIGQMPDGAKFKLKSCERAAYQVGPASWVELAPVKEKKS